MQTNDILFLLAYPIITDATCLQDPVLMDYRLGHRALHFHVNERLLKSWARLCRNAA